MTEAFQHCVLLDDFGLSEDGFSDALWSRSAIASVELDTEVLIGATRVVTGGEHNSSEAVAFTVLGVKLANEGGDSWRREEAMLTNIYLSDTIGGCNLDNLLDSDVVVVPTIARNDEGLAHVVDFWGLLFEGIEDGLDEVLQVVRLGEDLDLLTEAASAWLLVLVGFFDGDSLDCDLAGPDGSHRPLRGGGCVHATNLI